MPDDNAIDLQISSLLDAYGRGALTPSDVVELLILRLREDEGRSIWISTLEPAALRARAKELEAGDRSALPLYGVPFAVKDNIDVTGMETTAACPGFTHVAPETATVVRRLLDAGAMLVGKTNLDQFATGLVGVRSPYGACPNAFDPEFVSGGSSSGSAVATALGRVSFALGTDTAGSGRVPAAFNNLVGLKPTRGLLSTRGVVPACRTLDCVSIFALTCADAEAVLSVAEGYDDKDPYSRPAALSASPRSWPGADAPFVFGVPQAGQCEFFGNEAYRELFARSVDRLVEMGGEQVEIDFAPFLEVAALLYDGPWVAERYHAVRNLIEARPEDLMPVIRQVIGRAGEFDAVDGFAAAYRLQELRRICDAVWHDIDVLLTPTAGTTYMISEVEADPVRLNSNLGFYTNFVNLLDLAAVAVPTGFTPAGMPFGVTLAAPAFSDRHLLGLGARLHAHAGLPLGANGGGSSAAAPVPRSGDEHLVPLAVCGAHMTGMPLNSELTSRGARLRGEARSAPAYRFFALPGGPPARPGMVRDAGGSAIRLEVWEIPETELGGFMEGVRAPLAIGRVELESGEHVLGFVCEAYVVTDAEDITEFGDWRRFVASRAGAT